MGQACWPFPRCARSTVLKLSEFGQQKGRWNGLTTSDKWIGNKRPNSRDGPLILIKGGAKRCSAPLTLSTDYSEHPTTHSYPHITTPAMDHRPLAASLTPLPPPLGWFFLLATTLHLSSIPLHAPLVELGWRQRGRPLEPNDLVSLRFNGEIRCCWDNGRSAPEVKDNGSALRQAGVRLTQSVMPTSSSCFVFHKASPNCKEQFWSWSLQAFVQQQQICGRCA